MWVDTRLKHDANGISVRIPSLCSFRGANRGSCKLPQACHLPEVFKRQSCQIQQGLKSPPRWHKLLKQGIAEEFLPFIAQFVIMCRYQHSFIDLVAVVFIRQSCHGPTFNMDRNAPFSSHHCLIADSSFVANIIL